MQIILILSFGKIIQPCLQCKSPSFGIFSDNFKSRENALFPRKKNPVYIPFLIDSPSAYSDVKLVFSLHALLLLYGVQVKLESWRWYKCSCGGLCNRCCSQETRLHQTLQGNQRTGAQQNPHLPHADRQPAAAQ